MEYQKINSIQVESYIEIKLATTTTTILIIINKYINETIIIIKSINIIMNID
jgi:hypothetical protein